MVICLDIDNVLNNLTEEAIKLYNYRNNKNIQMSDITTYNFFDCLSRNDAEAIVSLFNEEELWDSLKPLYGSQDGVKQLIKQGHNIYLVTATDVCNFAWKVKWIEQHFPFISSNNIIRIMDKSLLRCDVLVDDSLDNLIGCFCDRICLDYIWNRNDAKDFVYDIRRATNWSDVINIIKQIDKEIGKWEK